GLFYVLMTIYNRLLYSNKNIILPNFSGIETYLVHHDGCGPTYRRKSNTVLYVLSRLHDRTNTILLTFFIAVTLVMACFFTLPFPFTATSIPKFSRMDTASIPLIPSTLGSSSYFLLEAAKYF